MMWYANNGYFTGMHFFWWVLFTILIVWIFTSRRYAPGERRNRDNALDMLRKRFASGEISKQEFEERKKVLKQN